MTSRSTPRRSHRMIIAIAIPGVSAAVALALARVLESRVVESHRLAGFAFVAVISAVVSAAAASAYRRACAARSDADEARARAERAVAEVSRIRAQQEQLMDIVSHDLRTPLAAIRLSSALLLERVQVGATEHRQVARIAASAARMARMISDLVDLGRVRRGVGLPVVMGEVDVREACVRAIAELQAAHPDRVIGLEVEGDTTASADADRLQQVVANLVGNALQHGAAGSPVDVSVRGGPAEITLAVHNTGRAIPQRAIPQLFEPYRRNVEDVEGERSGSSGLGLFIVREIVMLHGGRIDVESSEERGTRFVASIPRLGHGQIPGDRSASRARGSWVLLLAVAAIVATLATGCGHAPPVTGNRAPGAGPDPDYPEINCDINNTVDCRPTAD